MGLICGRSGHCRGCGLARMSTPPRRARRPRLDDREFQLLHAAQERRLASGAGRLSRRPILDRSTALIPISSPCLGTFGTDTRRAGTVWSCCASVTSCRDPAPVEPPRCHSHRLVLHSGVVGHHRGCRNFALLQRCDPSHEPTCFESGGSARDGRAGNSRAQFARIQSARGFHRKAHPASARS